MSKLYIIGDIHGQYQKFTRLLRDAGLVDGELNWTAGRAVLWLTGDFFDRGPHGVEALELAMRLQRQAQAAGGRMGALLGNHELLILAAAAVGDKLTEREGGDFRENWLSLGGQEPDLERLSGEQMDWIRKLPAVALEGEHLLIHTDSMFYLEYGKSVEEINRSIGKLVTSKDTFVWERLLNDYARRKEFFQPPGQSLSRAEALLAQLGGSKIIHGHTPIPLMTEDSPENVTGPLEYCAGLCLNVDGGMYMGGPGFVAELD